MGSRLLVGIGLAVISAVTAVSAVEAGIDYGNIRLLEAQKAYQYAAQNPGAGQPYDPARIYRNDNISGQAEILRSFALAGISGVSGAWSLKELLADNEEDRRRRAAEQAKKD